MLEDEYKPVDVIGLNKKLSISDKALLGAYMTVLENKYERQLLESRSPKEMAAIYASAHSISAAKPTIVIITPQSKGNDLFSRLNAQTDAGLFDFSFIEQKDIKANVADSSIPDNEERLVLLKSIKSRYTDNCFGEDKIDESDVYLDDKPKKKKVPPSNLMLKLINRID